uniref:Thyroglobulin type-1 domain-containing protein n=1 Tax=Strigamia maritima TaxID=126957 RepID=T1IVS3_STRMM
MYKMMISFCVFISCLVLRLNLVQGQKLHCNCEHIQCENITCPKDQVQTKIQEILEGSCDCCDVCVKYKIKGEKCDNDAKPVKKSVCSRFYTSDKCDVGLICDFDYYDSESTDEICSPDGYGPCFEELYVSYEEADRNSEWFLPIQCEKDGTYKPIQCKQDICFCVDKDGNRIFGDFPLLEAEQANCACSLMEVKLEEAAKVTGQFDHVICQKNGNFHKLQCLRDTCFCVNETTGNLTSSIVPKTVVDQLSCYDKTSYESLFNSPCQIQREYEERLASYYIKQQKVKYEYLTISKCNPDATYVAKQCSSETCFCANPITGLPIGSNNVPYPSLEEQEMNCQCLLDMIKGGNLQAFDCDVNGNYKGLACHH